MPKDILDIFHLGTNTGRLRSDQPNKANGPKADTVELPKCPKCNKIPLKCPTPNDCGMENL